MESSILENNSISICDFRLILAIVIIIIFIFIFCNNKVENEVENMATDNNCGVGRRRADRCSSGCERPKRWWERCNGWGCCT
jgi:hypothetical protein